MCIGLTRRPGSQVKHGPAQFCTWLPHWRVSSGAVQHHTQKLPRSSSEACPPESCTQMGDTTCRPCCRPHLTLSVWSPPATTCVTSGSVASVQLAPSCAHPPPSVGLPAGPKRWPEPGACCRLGRPDDGTAVRRKLGCRSSHGAAPSHDSWHSGACPYTVVLLPDTCVAVYHSRLAALNLGAVSAAQVPPRSQRCQGHAAAHAAAGWPWTILLPTSQLLSRLGSSVSCMSLGRRHLKAQAPQRVGVGGRHAQRYELREQQPAVPQHLCPHSWHMVPDVQLQALQQAGKVSAAVRRIWRTKWGLAAVTGWQKAAGTREQPLLNILWGPVCVPGSTGADAVQSSHAAWALTPRTAAQDHRVRDHSPSKS